MCSADFYLGLDVSLIDVRRSAESSRAVYTSAMSDRGNETLHGFTDGFYIGAPRPLATVLCRLDDDALWREPGPYDYEQLLRSAFDLHGSE